MKKYTSVVNISVKRAIIFFVASTHLTKRFIREILVCHKHFSIANDHFLSTVSRTIPSHLPTNMCLKNKVITFRSSVAE